MLRQLGLRGACSGYLIQLKADIDPIEGPRGTDKDFTDLHAWAEVYLPGAGWIGLDATSGMLTGEGHIPGRRDAALPHGGADHRPGRAGRHRLPLRYDRDAHRRGAADHRALLGRTWARLDAVGEQVDADLKAGDVRLTMGGEPTFVSVDDLESPEWNIAAVGPTKRGLADDLIRKLRRRFAPGGLLHYGQGKWYPGESLPRWAYALYWRKDGKPIWRNPELITNGRKNTPARIGDAGELAATIASNLGLEPGRRPPGLRGPGAVDRQGGATPGKRAIRPIRSWPTRKSGRGWRGCSTAG